MRSIRPQSEQCAFDSTSLALLDCAPSGLVAFSADGRLLVANRAAQEMLGLEPGPAPAALTRFERLSRDEQRRLVSLILGQIEGPLQITTSAGTHLTVARQGGVGETAMLVIAAADPTAEEPGRLDALTGLADRHTFLRRLTALCAKPDLPVSVMMIDLDYFKAVNDTLGHPAGDSLLKLVARRLRTILRQADVVSRLGGDEFAVAMVTRPELPKITARLVSVLSRPYLVEMQAVVISASIGVAHGPQHGSDPSALIRAADIALYRAKADGRGAARVFDAELGERSRRRYALADDLRRAIPLQQLEVHFQPQVCLQSRKLSGFEALVRWNHPTRGILAPDTFIPMAEEMGLILAVGDWVLQQACRYALCWPEDVTVAVNVSPLQLLDRKRLPRVIAATLASTGLPADRLEIEVTETALVREAETLAVLNEIRAMGVRLTMDDFGTGCSSLSQLRRFPFHKLKIDRSFVQDLGGSPEARAVVRAIAALGKSFGMITIAEGVETLDQEAICRSDGCTSMQGYLISRPVPGSDVETLIETLKSLEETMA